MEVVTKGRIPLAASFGLLCTRNSLKTNQKLDKDEFIPLISHVLVSAADQEGNDLVIVFVGLRPARAGPNLANR